MIQSAFDRIKCTRKFAHDRSILVNRERTGEISDVRYSFFN